MIAARMSTGIMLASVHATNRDRINKKTTQIAIHEKFIMNIEARVFSSSAKMGGTNKRCNRLSMMVIIYQSISTEYEFIKKIRRKTY